jgi:AAA domain
MSPSIDSKVLEMIVPVPAEVTDPERQFGIRTARQLKRRVEMLGRTEPIIEGLIPQQSITFVVGDSGLGKSPLFYQALLCVAAGIPFLGKNVRQSRVLYMDCENGAGQVEGIVAQLSKHLQLAQPPDDLLLWNLNDCPEDFGQPSASLRRMLDATKPKLVVLDPFNAIFNDVEKDNPSGARVYLEMRGLMRDFGCGFILIHHPRKSDKDSQEKDTLDKANLYRWFESARGPKLLINGSDVRLGVDRPSDGRGDTELIVRGFERVQGEIPAIRVTRVVDEDGEAVGYNRLTGAQLLSNEDQRTAFEQLPQRFQFRDAVRIYGRDDQPTRDFLIKCISAGILRQPAKRGPYEKLRQASGPEVVQRLAA